MQTFYWFNFFLAATVYGNSDLRVFAGSAFNEIKRANDKNLPAQRSRKFEKLGKTCLGIR